MITSLYAFLIVYGVLFIIYKISPWACLVTILSIIGIMAIMLLFIIVFWLWIFFGNAVFYMPVVIIATALLGLGLGNLLVAIRNLFIKTYLKLK